MKNVLVTGGGCYKGCFLAQKLLTAIYSVVAYDLMIFGDESFPKCPDLDVVKGCIIGTPSLESQAYASKARKEGHVNCKSAPQLMALVQRYFHNASCSP
jgi:nucleoside-diphosphate-sugar epimerase